MKNLLFSFIFVLLAFQLLAQQQPHVLHQDRHRLYHKPFMPRHAYPEQNHKMAATGEMDCLLPTMPNTEISIRVDSILFLDEYGNYKEIYTYDANGNLVTSLNQSWENYE